MKIVFLLLFSPFLLVLAALIKNGAISQDPPGMKTRVKQAFTRNVAETRDDHYYRELRTPAFEQGKTEVWQRSLAAGEALGWQLLDSDEDAGEQHWVITTALLRFKDDFRVTVREAGSGGSTLYIVSKSRKGSGDLGANVAHVRRFLKQLSTP